MTDFKFKDLTCPHCKCTSFKVYIKEYGGSMDKLSPIHLSCTACKMEVMTIMWTSVESTSSSPSPEQSS